MDKNNVAEVLRALASGDKSRSETARLRDVFSEVEAALQAGVSRSAILDTLQAQGFTMGMKGFESALYRIRKNRAKGQVQPALPSPPPAVKGPAAAAPPAAPANDKPATVEDEHSDATDLNEVQAALSNEQREADLKKYEQFKPRLKDRVNKGEAK